MYLLFSRYIVGPMTIHVQLFLLIYITLYTITQKIIKEEMFFNETEDNIFFLLFFTSLGNIQETLLFFFLSVESDKFCVHSVELPLKLA